jgi:hypothetical protein
MFRMDTNRRVAVLAVVVALSSGSSLAAAGWEMPARWMDSRDLLKDFTHVLNWLGVISALKSAPTCDGGMSIDPNGCPKTLGGNRGMSINLLDVTRAAAEGGMGVDPNGLH